MTRYLSASLVLSIGPTCQFPLSTTFEHLNMTSALHYAQVWRLVFLSSATLCSDQAKKSFRRLPDSSSVQKSFFRRVSYLSALVNKLVPWCAWLLRGALEIPRLLLRLFLVVVLKSKLGIVPKNIAGITYALLFRQLLMYTSPPFGPLFIPRVTTTMAQTIS